MPRYIAGRLLQALVATFGVMTIVFVVMRLSGDPTLLLVPEGATREHIDALRHELGFDRPILVQYLFYLGDLLRLDLGNSVVQRVPAVDILAARIPYTVALASAALLVALGVGIPVGIAMAVWRGRWFERPLAALVLAGQSLPTFLSGILLIMLFAVSLRWLPSSGADGPAAIIMPAVALGARSMSTYARMAGEAIRFSAADAEVNGLRYDGQQEEIAAATFAGSIRLAANDCLLDPTGDPMIPDWDRVESVLPEFLPDLLEAVQSDNRG